MQGIPHCIGPDDVVTVCWADQSCRFHFSAIPKIPGYARPGKAAGIGITHTERYRRGIGYGTATPLLPGNRYNNVH